MSIKTRAVSLSTIVFIIYLVILPIFGKVIDDQESVIFYGLTPFFFLNIFFIKNRKNIYPSITHLLIQSSLIILFIVSTIYSLNIGWSVYPLLSFITILLIINLYPYYLDNLDIFMIFIVIFGCIYSILLLAHITHYITLPVVSSADNFIRQIWGHSYLGDFLIFPVIIVLSKINPRNIKALLPLLMFLSISLLLTNSRSALVATICGTLFLSFKNKLSIRLKALFIFGALIFLINMFYQVSFVVTDKMKTFDGSRLEYWSQAIKGFVQSPVIGNGANTFDYFNRLYQASGLNGCFYASNSIFEALTSHGIIYTSIFFLFISSGLYYQFRHNNLLFCLGLASFINSLFDPSWTSAGIMTLSLIFIFYQHPLFYPSSTGSKKISNVFLSILALIVMICYLADSASIYYYSQKSYSQSLKYNPFNFDANVASINRNQDATLKLFGNYYNTYIHLISQNTLPQSESYYYRLFTLSPRQFLPLYQDLFNYYFKTMQSDKFDKLAITMEKNINLDDWELKDTIPIAKIIYQKAIDDWRKGNKEVSINNLKIALKFSGGWSHLHIELANAYWHNDQKDFAINQLKTECAKNTYSTPHCIDYLQAHPDKFLLPGNQEMTQAINDIVY